jgi:hypothetical protein
MKTDLHYIIGKIKQKPQNRFGNSYGYTVSQEDFCTVMNEGKKAVVIDSDRPSGDAGFVHQLTAEYLGEMYTMKTWTSRPWEQAFKRRSI